MKKIFFICLAVFTISLLALSACGDSDEPKETIVLREAIAHTPQDQIGEESIKMAERFNQRVEGYKLEIHHSESLVKFAESLDAVRTGTVELAQWPIDMFGNLEPKFNTMGLPFLFNNVEANVAGINELLPDYSDICEEKFNQKLIGAYTATSLDPLSTKPIRTLDDWKGLLVMALNPPSSVAIEMLGGSAVSIPFPDTYTSLDKGVVDAVMCSTNQMVIYSIYEVADYVLPIYIIPTAMTCAVNLDIYNDMPKDVQDILIEEHMKTAEILNDIFINLIQENLSELEANGVEIIRVSEDERNKWRDILMPYTQQVLEECGDFGDRVMDVADQVNAKYPYEY